MQGPGPPTTWNPGDLASTAALIRAVVGGDGDAAAAWYRSEHPRVYRLCLGFLADGTEADDLAQDAMLHLLDHLPSWDPNRSYPSWRNTVVLNLCRDRLRRREARRRAEEGAADQAPARGIPTPLPRPEDLAHRNEVRHALESCLAHLTPREREVFVMRDLEGHPTAETAAVLGVRVATVRSLLSLARRRLRNLLEERLPSLAGPRGGAGGGARGGGGGEPR